jgi:biotin carboxyl carrier protein
VAEIVVTPVGHHVYRVSDGGRSRVAYAVGSSEGTWVFVEGRVYVIEPGSPDGLPHRRQDVVLPPSVAQPFRAASGAGRRRSHASTDLSAPMPATVRTIAVHPGQRVSMGEVLIVLEAMKMELPIKAPRDATVKSVGCREGELVQPGVPLLELE